MAKPIKYPRKLRQKLEKITEKREEREKAQDADPEERIPTLWHMFLRNKSVAIMRPKFVGETPQDLGIENLYVLELPFHMFHETICVRPPWLDDDPPGSP